MSIIIVSFGMERLSGEKVPCMMNHRAGKILHIYREVSEEDKPSLVELRNILRSELMTLCRAEWDKR